MGEGLSNRDNLNNSSGRHVGDGKVSPGGPIFGNLCRI